MNKIGALDTEILPFEPTEFEKGNMFVCRYPKDGGCYVTIYTCIQEECPNFILFDNDEEIKKYRMHGYCRLRPEDVRDEADVEEKVTLAVDVTADAIIFNNLNGLYLPKYFKQAEAEYKKLKLCESMPKRSEAMKIIRGELLIYLGFISDASELAEFVHVDNRLSYEFGDAKIKLKQFGIYLI